jgi:anti-sigma factor RsiW
MTCTRHEKDLALYVEHDLADADAAAVEAHLGACPECRSFLTALRASQAWVKDLAAEEIDSDALAVMRVRTIVAAARARRSRHLRWVPAWVAAAAVILALGTLVWIALVSRSNPPRTAAVPSPPSSASRAIAPPVIAPPVIASGSPRSTLPGPAAVSPRMERAHVRRGTDRPSVVPTLSADDADQLARAVVAIARIQRVDEAPADDEPSPAPTPLMRLATADPDVVIYWQLDPNGGE